jgi:hypothetical protein
VLVLNSYTRWSYGELMEMAVEELQQWLAEIRRLYRKKG